jgi:hypothetical protein
MKEELLHFIWQSKVLLDKPMHTTTGEPISILHLGSLNTHSGPDFFNARIQIGDTIWAGNVEIHIRTSEWEQHKHQNDPAYNNVILHVVYVNDKEVSSANGQRIPTLELRNYIPATLLQRYVSLQKQHTSRIPCQSILVVPPQPILNAWLQRLLVERIEQKCEDIKLLLVHTHHHYEQCFYLLTARYFGMKINAQPFELLAAQLPLTLIAKYHSNRDDLLALVLGTSGLLPDMDPEFHPLISRFEHLHQKHNLNILDKSVWKFGRIRPANFPTVRLVQFASFLHQSTHLLSTILACSTLSELKTYYQKPMVYANRSMRLGAGAINVLLINSVLPFMFLYGQLQHKEELCERALNWYEALPSEKNTITHLFHSLGLDAKNAADTQAYIQLKNEYCTQLNCLHCTIGYQSLLYA